MRWSRWSRRLLIGLSDADSLAQRDCSTGVSRTFLVAVVTRRLTRHPYQFADLCSVIRRPPFLGIERATIVIDKLSQRISVRANWIVSTTVVRLLVEESKISFGSRIWCCRLWGRGAYWRLDRPYHEFDGLWIFNLLTSLNLSSLTSVDHLGLELRSVWCHYIIIISIIVHLLCLKSLLNLGRTAEAIIAFVNRPCCSIHFDLDFLLA